MDDQVLDETISPEVNPDNVKWAGFWIRVGASLIDGLIFLPIIGLMVYNQYSIKSLRLALILILVGIVYKPLLEFLYGATWGKMAVGIKVVNSRFEKIDMKQSIIRYIPWLLNNAVTIYASVILYTNEAFLRADDFVKSSQIQSELQPNLLSFVVGLLIIIAVVMVAFDACKQGLHDKMASTYVIYKNK